MHGIGGRTIEEARRRLTLKEVKVWQAYRLRRGTLNVGLMVEDAVARLAVLYANRHTREPVERWEFMPHHDAPEITLAEAMERWR